MISRLKIIIHGAVQGVGFRPFIFRLATELNLKGWVHNSPQGVFIEIEGEQDKLKEFLLRIGSDKPIHASIQSLEFSYLDPVGYVFFEIKPSEVSGGISALVLPDIATCPDCLREIFDPEDRRYLYPFTNCTNCGPRYSIIEALPYDRANTSMKKFIMCKKCQQEYDNPIDRRFHAQPNACPDCGPHLELWDKEGNSIAFHHYALLKAVEVVRKGEIVAVKGLGGFHLIVDVRKEIAVNTLRKRKFREEKPFALMFPSLDLVKEHCDVSQLEERLLLSAERPIVLLKRKIDGEIAKSVAPNNPYWGIMLPYTPLHHILLRELGFPVVATSGNLKDETICIDENEAVERLGEIADWFLVHNRPIVRHVDDSIVRLILDKEMVLRRARGYAPLPILLKSPLKPILTVGGHLKNTIAISLERNVFLSQHIGDLETVQSYNAFQQTIESLKKLYRFKPVICVCDKHPDYLSSKYARNTGLTVVEVQHHFAHILSCMTENEITEKVLGVSWDGTGYGLDGTIWGGEFLQLEDNSFQRIAHFRSFTLPGGEKAVKEPRRSALGVLFEILGDKLFDLNDIATLKTFSSEKLNLIRRMLVKRINSPQTSSAGRLFDAIASLIAVRQVNNFEGQAAMELEFLTTGQIGDESYDFEVDFSKIPYIIDWKAIIYQIMKEVKKGISQNTISIRFHNTLTEIIVALAKKIEEEKIVLSGGCFQNKYLTERTVIRLRNEGFRPYWHQRIPPNDGGIALGQVIAGNLGIRKLD